jgi:NADH:ubiquinone oxidoreductase subunit C
MKRVKAIQDRGEKMTSEEMIVEQLVKKYEFLKGVTEIKAVRRVYTKVPQDKFREVLEYCVDKMNFKILCTITGLDEVEKIALIYHIANDDGIVLNIRVGTSRDNPVIDTIIDVFPAAEIYEREMTDLLGVTVRGIPEGKRYPLPDDWPQGDYPLRKDWKMPDKEV